MLTDQACPLRLVPANHHRTLLSKLTAVLLRWPCVSLLRLLRTYCNVCAQVVAEAMNCTANIAKGMRKDYKGPAMSLCPGMSKHAT
jgi:hypothetical protein